MDSVFNSLLGGGRSSELTLAEMLDRVSEGPFPIRFTAYDGSSTGPADAEVGVDLKTPRGANFIATAPGDLGLARAFISGDMDLIGTHPGDPYPIFKKLIEEIRLRRPGARDVAAIARSLGRDRLRLLTPPPQETLPRWRRVAEGLRHSKTRDAEVIKHHYDVSNAFYEKVLGPSMTYTCAVYHSPEDTLEEAQEAKYQLVFDKLGLEPGMRLLDVGCGWGALSIHAAAEFDAQVVGVTISREQKAFADKRIVELGLSDRVEIRLQDYREIADGPFDAVTSLEMGEHVGEGNYPRYAQVLHDNAKPGARVLVQQMSRTGRYPGGGPFIESFIAPDMAMRPVGETVALLERAGLEVRDVHSLREHYVWTVDAWLASFEARWSEAVALVGVEMARVWRLYLVGGRLSFERGRMGVDQLLAVRPTVDGRSAMPAVRETTGAVS